MPFMMAKCKINFSLLFISFRATCMAKSFSTEHFSTTPICGPVFNTYFFCFQKVIRVKKKNKLQTHPSSSRVHDLSSDMYDSAIARSLVYSMKLLVLLMLCVRKLLMFFFLKFLELSHAHPKNWR